MAKKEIIPGTRIHSLTVIKEVGPVNKRRKVLCKCDCGNFKIIDWYELTRKKRYTSSCGCLAKQSASTNIQDYNNEETKAQKEERFNKIAHIKQKIAWQQNPLHQFAEQNNLTCTRQDYKRLYNTFNNMKKRCYHDGMASYKYYGAKGIKICKQWLENPENFYRWAIMNGYQDGLTIDRIDPNGHYAPNNCRWVTQKEQANNRTITKKLNNNDGIEKSLSEWADIYHIDLDKLYQKFRKYPNKTIEELVLLIS